MAPTTPLRQRMTQDMEERHLPPDTRQIYIDRVAEFARHFRKSPDLLGPQEIHTYQVYLVERRQTSWMVLNETVTALRFLYRVTLGRDWPIPVGAWISAPSRASTGSHGNNVDAQSRPVSEKSPSVKPLRRRMIEDMKMRNLSANTQKCYVERAAQFARHFGRSPEMLGPQEIRAYQVYLIEQKHASWTVLNQTVCALRFRRALAPREISMLPRAARRENGCPDCQ